MSNREEFEQLEDIKDILNDHKIFFNEKEDRYQAEKITGNDSVYYPSWEITYMNGAWYAWQEQQKKIDAHNEKLSLFIDELKKTHSEDMDNKIDYWRGFSDCAEATIKVFYRDVGVVTCKG